jgi:NAD(P)-dependent dehydrogenase (short-subunit alcohol dehydrogenase family)
MQRRDATCAVIGAGDFIGAEIAKKFASEGFTVFAGRRDRAKLDPLVKEIECADGSIVPRALDARKEDEVAAFLNDADQHAPLEICIFNIGANVNFPILETTDRVFRKVWEMAYSLPARPPPSAAAAVTPPSPAPSSDCARWPRRWHASWGRKTFTWPI